MRGAKYEDPDRDDDAQVDDGQQASGREGRRAGRMTQDGSRPPEVRPTVTRGRY